MIWVLPGLLIVLMYAITRITGIIQYNAETERMIRRGNQEREAADQVHRHALELVEAQQKALPPSDAELAARKAEADARAAKAQVEIEHTISIRQSNRDEYYRRSR